MAEIGKFFTETLVNAFSPGGAVEQAFQPVADELNPDNLREKIVEPIVSEFTKFGDDVKNTFEDVGDTLKTEIGDKLEGGFREIERGFNEEIKKLEAAWGIIQAEIVDLPNKIKDGILNLDFVKSIINAQNDIEFAFNYIYRVFLAIIGFVYFGAIVSAFAVAMAVIFIL